MLIELLFDTAAGNHLLSILMMIFLRFICLLRVMQSCVCDLWQPDKFAANYVTPHLMHCFAAIASLVIRFECVKQYDRLKVVKTTKIGTNSPKIRYRFIALMWSLVLTYSLMC